MHEYVICMIIDEVPSSYEVPEEVGDERLQAGKEGSLDYGGVRWYRPPLRLQLYNGAADDYNSSGHYPRF